MMTVQAAITVEDEQKYGLNNLTGSSIRNPNFKGNYSVGPDNLPYLDDASNALFFGGDTLSAIKRGTPGTSIIDAWSNDPNHSSIVNPDFVRGSAVSWDNPPFLDNASMVQLLGPRPIVPAAQLSTADIPTGVTANLAATVKGISKAEWIGIAVLVAALFL
jgi:hypothetical protein